jgi:hypothetical protein
MILQKSSDVQHNKENQQQTFKGSAGYHYNTVESKAKNTIRKAGTTTSSHAVPQVHADIHK